METISEAKLINLIASSANNGWHWHVPTIFVGHAFVLKKTL